MIGNICFSLHCLRVQQAFQFWRPHYYTNVSRFVMKNERNVQFGLSIYGSLNILCCTRKLQNISRSTFVCLISRASANQITSNERFWVIINSHDNDFNLIIPVLQLEMNIQRIYYRSNIQIYNVRYNTEWYL